ncbi:MAG TPA: SCO family protein [Burkholderiales bacterium]|nr:SCO family protein [Burkholderiales bacterium]
MRIVLLLLIGTLMATVSHAADIGAVPPQQLTPFEPVVANALLPFAAQFRDEHAANVRLGDYFGRDPVVLTFGYFRCPNLCETLLEGVLQALFTINGPPRYTVVALSIDPTETPAVAAQKQRAYSKADERIAGRLHLLTGTPANIAAVTTAAGFHYRYDERFKQYVHPAGFLVVTPEGRISRYFSGVRFAPRDVRLALIEAAGGRVGSTLDRLLLICSHYDPATGRYTATVMIVVRLACAVLVLLLGLWAWRHRRGGA